MKALLIVAGKETFIVQPSYEELLIKSNRDVVDLQLRPLLDFPSLVERRRKYIMCVYGEAYLNNCPSGMVSGGSSVTYMFGTFLYNIFRTQNPKRLPF